jgi:hypothetical protein
MNRIAGRLFCILPHAPLVWPYCRFASNQQSHVPLCDPGRSRSVGRPGEEPEIAQTEPERFSLYCLSGPNRPGPSRPDTNKKAIPSRKGMASSKGKHVVSSRTAHPHYSKNSSDLGAGDQEIRPSQTLATQNSTHSHSHVDDLNAQIEAPRTEERTSQDALPKSLPDKQCESVRPDNRDHGDDERVRGAEEARRQRIREARENLEATRELEALLADLDMSGAGMEGPEAADDLDTIDPNETFLDQAASPPSDPERSKNASDSARDRSKNVSSSRSKKVSVRRRRSPTNDAKIIAKIRDFVPSDDSPACTSSVSYSLPSLSCPSVSITASSPPTPANDNRIPVWPLTGDTVTAVCATVALLIAETPAVAFTFNLTPEAIADAKRDPSGFLDPLKRRFDRQLKRLGIALPYWFAIDIDDDGRPHIHGTFLPPAISLSVLRKIRKAMKVAWGKWEGPGKHKQVLFKMLYSDDWATYCIRNQRSVQKAIGPRTFTISHPLRRDAEWAYTEIRRIMREDESKFFCAAM